jgi:hypothetical protein
MDIQQQKHLDRVLTGVEIDLPAKYRKGVLEHGGHIEKKGIATLIAPEIRAEAIDLIVYSDCLSEGLNKIREICVQQIEDNKVYENEHVNGVSGYQVILRVLDGEIQELK